MVKDTEYSTGSRFRRNAAVPQKPDLSGSSEVAFLISVACNSETLFISSGRATASSSDQYSRVKVGLHRSKRIRGEPYLP